MSNAVIYSVALVLVTASFLPVTEGLKCYTCWNVDIQSPDQLKSDDGLTGNPTCVRGMTPEHDLLLTCPVIMDADGKELTPVCVQTYVELKDEAEHEEYKITTRGCFYANSSDEELTKGDESCSLMSGEELMDRAEEGPMKDHLESLLRFPSNVTAEFCRCDSDNCNPSAHEPEMTGGGGMSSSSVSLSIPVTLMLLLAYNFLLL